MTVRVLQVDISPRLAPYTYEEATIAATGGELIVADCTTEAEVIAQAQDAEILLVSKRPLVTPAVMDALPNCRLLVRWGVGYDQFDVAAATARGIAVANAPTYCTEDVAEHAIALLTAISRRIVWTHEHLRKGDWNPPDGPIHRLRGRTLGIIGCGRIGSAVAWRAQALGLNVIAYDRYRPAADLRALNITPVSLDDLLAQSNYITLHVPLTSETHHLIDAATLAKMKPDAMLVNTCRGPVIDEAALAAAMSAGHLAGAALDVYHAEPLSPDSPLRHLEHVILTPHAAAFTLESLDALRAEMCATVAAWIRTGWAAPIVNPEVRPALRPRLAPVVA